MRFTALAACTLFWVLPAVPSLSESTDLSAYLFRLDDGSFVSVPIADPTGYVAPLVIGEVDWLPVDTTLNTDGRVLTINPFTDELVSISPINGEIEILSSLSVDISWEGSGLFWGTDGSLKCYTENGMGTDFFDVDPNSGQLTFEGTSTEFFETIEQHDGFYYGGGFRSFWEIDPQDYSVALIREFSGPYSGCRVWGLTSTQEDLWCGLSCWGGTGMLESSIEKIDPNTGQTERFVFVGLPLDQHAYRSLQLIDQAAASPIPSVQRIGLAILVFAIGFVGIIVLRKGLW